ncbi:MAG TPA: POTRA domain-containing protein [Candidatus Angelobacter sp.]|nr:POTRA domain-containing protein [Candidatus Angelobacter sp.]
MKTFFRICIAAAVLAAALTPEIVLHAQQTQEAVQQAVSYEGQKVASVQLAGQPDGNQRQWRALIVQQENAPYSQAAIDKTAAALKQAGPFEKVEVDVEPQAAGLRVLFVLQPAYYFGVFRFPKAENRFSYTRLLQITSYTKQEPFSQERVEAAESNLLEFFHRTGYFMATVEPKLDVDRAHGVVNVEYEINLKRRAKFGEVTITGVPEAQSTALGRSLRSLRARIRGALIKPGKGYSLRRVETATTFLQRQLGTQHYLAARVKLVSSLYNPETNRADVTFDVTQGPRIEIQLVGARVWKRTQRKLIPMYQEYTVDPDLVNEGKQNLISHFQSKGFFDVKVQSKFDRHTSGVTVVYEIEKGKRGKVKSVEFHGNDHFSDKNLQDQVSVSRGMPWVFFSRGRFSELLVRKSVRSIEGLYRNAGYSEVKVTPSVERKRGNLELAFQVEEGVRDIVESLRVEGLDRLSREQLAPKGMRLEPGKPFSTQLLNRDRDQILAAYLDHGFLTATFKATVRHSKTDPHLVDVLYEIDEGPEVTTASVAQIGGVHTRPEIVARNANIKTGNPLSTTALLRGESQLYNLGIFDWASVDTRRPVADDPQADVLLKLHESKRNSITYGFGFQVINRGGSIPSGTVALPGLPPVGLPAQFETSQQTFWGPEGSIEYTRRNFRGRAQTLILSAFAGRLDQRGAASWANPSFWNGGWISTVTLSAERNSTNPIFTARQGGLGIQFQHYLDKNRQKFVVVRYDFRRTSLSNIVIPDLVLPEDQNVRISSLTASFNRDTRDNPIDAHHGIYETVQVAMVPKALGSNTNFGAILGQTAYYKSLTDDSSVVWANSLRLGFQYPFGGAHIPISESFFSGGGSTLRGFSLNGAGPQRNVSVCPVDNPSCGELITVPVGGKELVILNTEMRFPLGISIPFVGGELGGAAFYDGGNVYTNVNLKQTFTDFSHTVGFGFRYKTPVGPIRFDIGHLINAPPGVKSTQYFITLGQAF